MSNPEIAKSSETGQNKQWTAIFSVLKEIAHQKITDHGRNRAEKTIDREITQNEIRVRINSDNIDKQLIIKLSVTGGNSEKENIRPPKGINMVWATGVEEQYRSIEFILGPDDVRAIAKPLAGLENEKIELNLVDDFNAANTLFYLASFAIDRGNKPHLF